MCTLLNRFQGSSLNKIEFVVCSVLNVANVCLNLWDGKRELDKVPRLGGALYTPESFGSVRREFDLVRMVGEVNNFGQG